MTAIAAGSTASSDLRGVDILVVEDEGMTRDTMCRLLEHAAARVRAVDSEDRRQVLDAGFDEHLAKPLDADQLLATLARLVQRSTNA